MEESNLNKMITNMKMHKIRIPPRKLKLPFVDCDLANKIRKTEEIEAKTIAEECINKISNSKLVIYTDGSKNREVRPGVYIPEWKMQKEYNITTQVAVCTAEMVGILKVLETVNKNPPHDSEHCI